MGKIYIIQGSTGEHEDRTDWLVKAFTSKEKAEEVRNLLLSKLDECGLSGGYISNLSSCKDSVKKMQEYDENFLLDYTGSYYSIVTVDCDC